MRDSEAVTPLELFFDVVFVLAITQCTAYMADHPTWTGIFQALLMLAVLWWGWGGYAWLTSVVDPEEGAVRFAMFGAMAALLVVSLAIPDAFGETGLLFAGAYGMFRIAHLVLFWSAASDDPELRRSLLTGLIGSTVVAVTMLAIASTTDGGLQMALWALAISLDLLGPYLRGSEGWRLEPAHFAERFRLIIIIALGESIVAIGAGVSTTIGAAEVAAAVLGTAVAAGFWWTYFDVVAYVSEQRLVRATPGREQNEKARDVYGYLHFLLVAGIVLVALGLKKTLGDPGEALKIEIATALFCGAALYLLGHVAIRLRNIGTLSRPRLTLAVLLIAATPLITEIPALASVAILTAALAVLIAYETRMYGERRAELREEMHAAH
jgi:low temperature requirement protein LtrA